MFINWAPDAIPITLFEFLTHFYYTITSWEKYNIIEAGDSYHTIYGYSCRCLFEVVLSIIHQDTTKYSITPIHHTSFRNIIEKTVSNDKIRIIDLNHNYQELVEVDYTNTDIVIITHLFGQDFDLSKLALQKKKHKFIIIEDRVQGGTNTKPFSHSCVDISLYSMGMDKRPVALGGGYMNVRKGCHILSKVINKLDTLPPETNLERFISLCKKIPTFAIYNYSCVFSMTTKLLSLCGLDLPSAISSYRKKNPGFHHDNYLRKPSNSLLKSIQSNIQKANKIERVLIPKYNYLHHLIQKELIPWSRGSIVTIYNTIHINAEISSKLLERFKYYQIPYIKNPTWKVLEIADNKYQEFCDSLYYLPCIYHMNYIEINYVGKLCGENFSK